jgi:hypothetical protein
MPAPRTSLLSPNRDIAAETQPADPARHLQHDEDEHQRNGHFPVAEAVAQSRCHEADQHRAGNRADQAEAAADRGPDQQFRGEHEAHRLRRDDALMRRVERACQAGDAAADGKGRGFQHRCAETEELKPFLVLAYGDQQLPERRPHHMRQHQGGGGQHANNDEIERLVGIDARQAGNPGHAVEPAGNPAQRIGKLEAEHRQRQRDQREIGARVGLPVEHQRADESGQQRRHQAGDGEGRNAAAPSRDRLSARRPRDRRRCRRTTPARAAGSPPAPSRARCPAPPCRRAGRAPAGRL